jgi:muconate cycloisomerase
MAALPELSLGCEFYMATYYLTEDILTEPFPVRNGYVHVPSGPGLGVGVDLARLEKHTVQALQVH